MRGGAEWVPGTAAGVLFFLWVCHHSQSLGVCPPICPCQEHNQKCIVICWGVGICSQPVELTASQRNRNILYHQPLGHLLHSQAWLHEIDWIRGNQEWRFAFIHHWLFPSHSVFSVKNYRLWCFNYYDY